MRSGMELVHIEWLVAAVAPSTVSPHPNFSIKRATGPQILGLLSEHRLADFGRYRDESTGLVSWEMGLLNAVWESLLADSQLDAANWLSNFVRQPEYPLGARAAAALFSCLALSERGRSMEAVDLLDYLIAEIPADQSDSASRRLLRAVLSQQRTVRLIETGRRDQAWQAADAVIAELDSDLSGYERFSVSSGIGWDSAQVQRDIEDATRFYAREIHSRLESIEGNRWVDLLRSRPRWLDVRADRRELSATDAFLRMQFREQISAVITGKTLFMSDPVREPLYAALLAAELSGDTNEIVRRRELLGRARALTAIEASSPVEMQEALRLLRHSNQNKTLKDLSSWVLARGPLVSLQSEGARILEEAEASGLLSRSSLLLLADASEFMNAQERARSIELVFAYRHQDEEPALASTAMAQWSRDDEIFRCLAKLVRGSGIENLVAETVILIVEEVQSVSELAYRSLHTFVQEVDWQLVQPAVVQRWTSWANSPAGQESERTSSALLDAIAGPARTRAQIGRPTGNRLAVRLLIESAEGLQANVDELSSATEACIAQLRAVQEDARKGSRSIGEYSPTEVAVALITELGVKQLWRPLIELLIDDAVSIESKRPAFDRLASAPYELPDEIQSELRANWTQVVASPAVGGIFDNPPLPHDAALLRFAARYKMSDEEVLFEQVMALAGGDQDAGREEAAKSVAAFVKGGQGGGWPLALAVQLSHDTNPSVQGNASASLVQLTSELTYGNRLARMRLREMLEMDGLRVPKLTLEAFFRVLRTHEVTSSLRELEPALSNMASNHIARNVREAASKVAERLG